jgi:hypothetical protein
MLPTFNSRPKVIGVVTLMMMKDGLLCALLLCSKLSSPHRALVLIKQFLCTKVLSFTSCASSLLFSTLDRFFCFGQFCCTLLHSQLSSPCLVPFVKNVSSHKNCLSFQFVWFFEKFSFFWLVLCCYRLLCSKLSSSHCSSSPLF